jgi:hypothetical protein
VRGGAGSIWQARSSADLLFLVVCASLLWAVSLPAIDLARMTDLGLVSVIPPSLVAALAALTISFCLSLHQARSTLVLVLHVAVLVVMLYGITTVLADVPRFNVALRHIGVADYIARTGAVDPGIDAYFNWPGFFVLGAFVGQLTGVDPTSFANWAPVVFNLLYLAPLVVILRTATRDERLVWLAVWFFYLTNWIGQDYFAPQGLAYFLYLVLLAVLLRWFRREPAGGSLRDRLGRLRAVRRPGAPDRGGVSSQAGSAGDAALLGLVIVVFASLVPTHQLTPLMALLAVAALVVAGRCSARGLPVLMAVMIGAWASFLAVAYMVGHVQEILAQVGQLGTSVESSVGSRIEGTPEHLFVVRTRMLLTALLWGLAAAGWLRSWRRGARQPSFVLLGIAPFTLLALQSYGGEIMLRVYLFALPFLAYFAASLFFPTVAAGRAWRTTRAVLLVSLVLLAGFSVARYGNERMDEFTTPELRAVNRLYEIAPPGSLLIAGSPTLPWRFRAYEQYKYDLVTKTSRWQRMNWKRPRLNAVAREVQRQMQSDPGRPAYLILTRTEGAGAELLGLSPPGALRRFQRVVASLPAFKRVFHNRDAVIFTLAHPRREQE